MMIQRPKGTQDLLPGMIEHWQYLEDIIRTVCCEYGYEEIRTPVFEATELFQRGVGQTTDIVNKEMYTFLDKGDRSLTLRPEMTASVCRAYVENKLFGQSQPVKLYYIGPMFRYERPQSGRFRQFHQFGVEVLGAHQAVVDAEVISLVWNIYQRLGLSGLEVHVNSVGCPVCRTKHRAELQQFLSTRQEKLCKDCLDRFARNPLRTLDCKNPDCQAATEGAPTTLDSLCEDCSAHLERVLALLGAAGVAFRVDPRLVRGLDYYTKTAFEVMAEELGTQSAICGGGRYDGLVEEIGGPPTPGFGFAMGLERVLAVLQVQNKLPEEKPKFFAMLIALGEKAQKEGFSLLSNLRTQGIPVSIDLLNRSLKAQLKAANRQGARYALILGEEELEKEVLLIRDLIVGEQTVVPFIEAVEEIIKMYQRGVQV
ncbi:MAG: histidine--tRNA ligase [Desulfosporosinus sp.]